VSRIQPAYQQVADQLRALIMAGTLAPGDRLPVEAELSASFGVSRSTVREALRVLGSQGLVRTARGVTGGTFVSETDPDAISDYLETRLGLLTGHDIITSAELLEARHLLEVPAARLAAQRRTQEHIDAMRLAIELEKAESERGARFTQHKQFHSVLLEAAGNRLLDVMTVPVFRVIRARFTHDSPSGAFWHEVDEDHAEILERIEREDADGAARAMDEHLERLRAIYSRADATGGG
jgi:GntR family transcriptional repressor for pyruvate dehydrogenase complex